MAGPTRRKTSEVADSAAHAEFAVAPCAGDILDRAGHGWDHAPNPIRITGYLRLRDIRFP